MFGMLGVLVAAACLEVGGDALIRRGLGGGGGLWMVAGAAVLVAYGFAVNLTKVDFGKWMGLYIAVFFGVAQVVAMAAFKEKPGWPVVVGGSLVVAGGLVMAFAGKN